MLNGIEVYYPLEVGCGWVYLCKDGSSYTNMITPVNPADPNEFTIVNSLMNKNKKRLLTPSKCSLVAC